MRKAQIENWQQQLAVARTHHEHREAEFFTTIAQLVDGKAATQTAIAKQLHTSQAQVSRFAEKGREIAAQEINGVGRSPYHAAERYSRREITRKELIDALTNWPYVEGNNKTEGLHDDLLNYVPGSFDDVEAAFIDELIDDEIYEAALNGLKAQISSVA